MKNNTAYRLAQDAVLAVVQAAIIYPSAPRLLGATVNLDAIIQRAMPE